jgi:hypothetical protein
VIAESERPVVYAKGHLRLSIASALPCKRASRAWRQRTLEAQLVHIKRKTGLDSSLSHAVMSPGATTAHLRHLFSKSFGNNSAI